MRQARTVIDLPARTADRMPGERLWTVQEASAWLGVPVNTLYGWRTRGEGPRAARLGRHLRYVPADVRAWVEQRAS